MQNFKNLYTELATLIKSKIAAVKWIDLWHNQVSFLEDEHPFPTPAIFLDFRILQTDDTGLRVQKVRMQVDCYVYYETFADTYQDSWNQSSALEFLNLINDLQIVLHASDGANYSGMRRIAMQPVDTGNAGNTYQVSFECVLMDYAAQIQWQNSAVSDMNLVREDIPGKQPEKDEYKIDL